MSLNRKIQPKFKNIENISLPEIQTINLDNNNKMFAIRSGMQDILKIDVIFDINIWGQYNPLVASTVNKMLIEGTQTLTSQQIAEKLDFFGAFIHLAPTKDFANITLYTIRKYLPETIQILSDIIKNPIFSEKELNIFLNKKKQKFLIDLQKVSELAKREFNEQLFGENHPYGKKLEVEDFENINHEELVLFHKENYTPENCKIIISGKVEENDFVLFNNYFGNKNRASYQRKEYNVNTSFSAKTESFLEKENASQSAIRLGKVVILKNHPDFHNLEITNTILGGYFGSRLMKKIREEKAYTYGINSFIVTLKNAGYFTILSEVGSGVTKNAINDILGEIKKLREELITEDELTLVKNYMTGELLRSFDGPLEVSTTYKSLIELGMGIDYFEQRLKSIKEITPLKINEIASKYLHEDTLVKTIAGKYN